MANHIKCSDYFDKFSLLTHTDEQNLYFDNLLVASNVIVQRTTRVLANHIKCSDYFDKFSLLTHTDEHNLYFDNFFYDKCTCSKASMGKSCAYRRANKTCHIKTCHRKLARL